MKSVAIKQQLLHGSIPMLNFNGSWRFDSPGAISNAVSNAFYELIGRIATQGDRQDTLEHFKTYFANASGSSSSWSSSESWAESDLQVDIERAEANAPLFIEAFYDACASLETRTPPIAVPPLSLINKILFENGSGYQIHPPNLVSSNLQTQIAVPQQSLSLDAQAQEMIQKSLKDSERFLAEGHYRPAVQEILWLLETVSTAFQGLNSGEGTIEGKYFNKIVGDLRKHNRNTTLEQILNWMMTLHGFLSSPTGGGIRHGADLKAGIATQADEARLYCNLIRSYITYLLTEHARLSR